MNIDATEIMVIASMSDGSFDCVGEAHDPFAQILVDAATDEIMWNTFGVIDCPDFDPRSKW